MEIVSAQAFATRKELGKVPVGENTKICEIIESSTNRLFCARCPVRQGRKVRRAAESSEFPGGLFRLSFDMFSIKLFSLEHSSLGQSIKFIVLVYPFRLLKQASIQQNNLKGDSDSFKSFQTVSTRGGQRHQSSTTACPSDHCCVKDSIDD